MKSFIFLAICLFQTQVFALEYTDDLCENYQKIAQEFIDSELAGARWQGVVDSPACLVAQHPQTMNVDRSPASDPAFLDPEYILPDSRNIAFTVKRVPSDLLEVVMTYIGRKGTQDTAIKDKFTLKLNYGKTRALRGCASYYSEPTHFVMRARCWKS